MMTMRYVALVAALLTGLALFSRAQDTSKIYSSRHARHNRGITASRNGKQRPASHSHSSPASGAKTSNSAELLRLERKSAIHRTRSAPNKHMHDGFEAFAPSQKAERNPANTFNYRPAKRGTTPSGRESGRKAGRG